MHLGKISWGPLSPRRGKRVVKDDSCLVKRERGHIERDERRGEAGKQRPCLLTKFDCLTPYGEMHYTCSVRAFGAPCPKAVASNWKHHTTAGRSVHCKSPCLPTSLYRMGLSSRRPVRPMRWPHATKQCTPSGSCVAVAGVSTLIQSRQPSEAFRNANSWSAGRQKPQPSYHCPC